MDVTTEIRSFNAKVEGARAAIEFAQANLGDANANGDGARIATAAAALTSLEEILIDLETRRDGAIDRFRRETEDRVRENHDRLSAAFKRVHDPDDWRAPIAAWVDGESVDVVVDAIRHFTGTDPRVEEGVDRGRWLVTSEGYRNGPCGP